MFPISINWGRYLLDIDECSENFDVKMNDCHLNASCVNTQGSYNCSCNPTYIGNGSICEGKFIILSLRNFIMYVLLNVTKERAVLLVLLLLLLLLLSLLLIFNLNFYNIFRTPRNSRNELLIFFLFLFIYFLFLYYFQCNLIKLK